MRKNCALNKMYLESFANATYSASGADFSNVAVIGQRGRESKSNLLASSFICNVSQMFC